MAPGSKLLQKVFKNPPTCLLGAASASSMDAVLPHTFDANFFPLAAKNPPLRDPLEATWGVLEASGTVLGGTFHSFLRLRI